MAVGKLVPVARVEDVPPGTAATVSADDRELALFNVAGTFYATQHECLHLKGPLGRGELHTCVITCPWHGWQYDVRTGQNEFDRAIQLRTYEVWVENGEVLVRV